MQWRNFLSPWFGAKFQMEVPLSLVVPEFPYNAVWDSWKEAPMQIQLDSFSRFDTIPGCDGQTDRCIDTGP